MDFCFLLLDWLPTIFLLESGPHFGKHIPPKYCHKTILGILNHCDSRLICFCWKMSMKSESWMPEKWSIKSVVEDQRLMKLHECACEMISKVSENKDLKPHECGRSTLSSKNSRLELEQGLKKPHFLHLQFCTCNNSFPRIPSRHNFCLKESPEFQTLWL